MLWKFIPQSRGSDCERVREERGVMRRNSECQVIRGAKGFIVKGAKIGEHTFKIVGSVRFVEDGIEK